MKRGGSDREIGGGEFGSEIIVQRFTSSSSENGTRLRQRSFSLRLCGNQKKKLTPLRHRQDALADAKKTPTEVGVYVFA